MIETDRLILRNWREEDRNPFAALNADPRVMEFFPKVLTSDESNTFLEKVTRHHDKHGFTFFAVEEKVSGRFIGMTGLATLGENMPMAPGVEVGWRLAFDHWGQGFATEAASAALDFGFSTLGLDDIVSFTARQNERSYRVMEKIGMMREEKGDFQHPNLPLDHWLSWHVLYRVRKQRE